MTSDLDILIHSNLIYDGSGGQPRHGCLGVSKGKIQFIKDPSDASAVLNIDAVGLAVTPGFIDMHSHVDMSLPFDPRAESMVQQGITTAVFGNCGVSLAPVTDESLEDMKKEIEMFSPPGAELKVTWRTFAEYLNYVEQQGSSINLVPLVGFGSIRMAGGPSFEDREPTSQEIEQMRDLVRESMEAGAFGMSTGLIYPPQVYAKTEEIIPLAEVVAEYNGLYFSHIRSEGAALIESVEELIEIVEKSGCRGGEVGHHKAAGEPFWGTSKDTLKLMEDARNRGLDITCDQYPYNRGATSLITVLPPWMLVGGVDAALERLEDENNLQRIRKELKESSTEWENLALEAGWGGLYISSVKTETWAGVEGKSIEEITIERGLKDGVETLARMLIDEKGEVSMTIESMGEEDIERIMKHPFTMYGCDGSGAAPTGVMSHGKPHPRNYGTFPRILGRFVREKKNMKFEQAVHKMTGLPARKLGFQNRGLLKEGFWADLVIFDPKTIKDTATYQDPHRFPKGISYVIVNGKVVVENGKQDEKLSGRVLRSGDK
jgi:N-acyl-D-amino-acid deacylase